MSSRAYSELWNETLLYNEGAVGMLLLRVAAAN